MADGKHYLYRIQPTRPGMLTEGPTAEEQRVVSEHFQYLKGRIALRAEAWWHEAGVTGSRLFPAQTGEARSVGL